MMQTFVYLFLQIIEGHFLEDSGLNFFKCKIYFHKIHTGIYKLVLQYFKNAIRLIKISFSLKAIHLPPTHVSSQSPSSSIDVSKSHG